MTLRPAGRGRLLTEVGLLWVVTCICLAVAFGAFMAGYAKARRDLGQVLERYRECCDEGARLCGHQVLPRRSK